MIEKSLRHATKTTTEATLSPTPAYRWEAISTYVSGSGSPLRVDTWSASNGGIHMSRETANGPLMGSLSTQGVFFEGSTTRTPMSGSAISSSIKHAFIVAKLALSANVEILVGFSNANNHYLYFHNGTLNYAGSGVGAGTGTSYWYAQVTKSTPWRGSTSSAEKRNLLHMHFNTGANPWLGFNTGSGEAWGCYVDCPADYYYPLNTKVRFGRRSNATPDDAPYSGSLFEVLLYTSSLSAAETGSVITYLSDRWLTD